MSRKHRGLGLLAVGALLVVTGIAGLATGRADADSGTGSQTFRETVNRVFYAADGSTTPADPSHPNGYNVSLTVSSTQNLRGNQPVTVSWTGAHPTGGIVQNPAFGSAGSQMEYPFLLLECRGTAQTVSPSTCWTQTHQERVQRTVISDYPAWRADGKAAKADRAARVGLPAPARPSTCRVQTYEHWVPMVSASGATYWGGGSGCYDAAPETSESASTTLPDNTTYGITNSSGSGSAKFAVWTSDENSTLGCSATVPCSLVAVPITGIDCDPSFSQADPAALGVRSSDFASYSSECEAPDVYAAGEPSDNNGSHFNLATSGRLWWSASNWDNRIVVPLNFALSGSVCSVLNPTPPLLAYGSTLMADIAAQWQPVFCTRPGFQPFLHVQSTDNQARTLVDAGTIKLGLSSGPPTGGFQNPVAQAPVGISGFAIAYDIDGPDGQPYTRLQLDARLLAKLLTESYQGSYGSEDSAISGNPKTIVADPEFHALNPDLPSNLSQVLNAAAALITSSSDSDTMTALSTYIADDPDARRWLEGVPDPWGMKVNPAYQTDVPAAENANAFHLPVTSWPLLDDFSLPASDQQQCLVGKPFLAQVAHPVAQVGTVVQDVEFGVSNSQTVCPEVVGNDPAQNVARIEGLQTPGHRFAIGVVPVTALARYGLEAAALQTSTSVGPQTKFTDSSGRTFASPDTAGMTAAVSLLKPNTAAATWTFDYASLDQTPKAYPGLMPVYADVPTSGLSPTDAARLAQLLTFAAGEGQTPGSANGQLAPGALPLTTPGLGDELAYTRCAVQLVRAQTGTVPPLTGACPTPPVAPKPTKKPATHRPAVAAPSIAPPRPVLTGPSVPAPVVPSVATSAPATQTVADAPALKTVGATSAVGRFGLRGALVLGLVLLVWGLLLQWGAQGWALAVAGARAGTARAGALRAARTQGRRRR